MYSIVLMMAVNGTAEVPDFGRRRCYACSYGCGCYSCCSSYYGCYGCYGGCYSLYRGCACTSTYSPMVVPGTPMQPAPMPKPPEPAPAPKKADASGPAPATIWVSWPPEGRLVIDSFTTTSIKGRQLFRTPPLEPGKDFFYDMRVLITHEGRTQILSKRVPVRAGDDLLVTLNYDSPGVSLVSD